MGEIGNPICGDMMKIFIKIEDDHIKDIKFQTFGCGAAIAVSSMITEMSKGKNLEEAKKITNKLVAQALEGLPKNKLHCSNLGADALQMAIKDYEDKKAGKVRTPVESQGYHCDTKEESCKCPYCEAELPEGTETCPLCGRHVETCN